MKLSLIAHTVILLPALAFSQNAWDYGKQCAQELGVELPANMNCADGVEIPVTGKKNGSCDRPSFGVAGCHSGSRILQFVDTIQRNGFQERIRTTVQCRKADDDPNSDYEFAVIQHNETNNKVCWFFPGYGKSYPAPYTSSYRTKQEEERLKAESDRKWAGNSSSGCNSCHNSGTYLRTPWIMQVNGSQRGSFVRDGGTGNYAAGGRITFAQSIAKKGYACDVGDPGKRFPPLVKINAEAFDSYLSSKGNARPANTASPATCTRCHYMGSGGTTCQMASSGLGTTTPGSRLHYPDNRWMPPESDWPESIRTDHDASEEKRKEAEAAFLNYYKSAIEAVNFCCDSTKYNETAMVNGRAQKICQGGTFPENPNAQTPCTPVANGRHDGSGVTGGVGAGAAGAAAEPGARGRAH